MERRALEEERRRGYARYRFLKGFKVSLRGGSVRAGVGHGEVARAVQGRGATSYSCGSKR